ncbi:MAG TPA: hypothetical protein GXX29_04835 [Firmicutes bacterium]|nr:hypothetical protein [Bacillota bacterium]
MSTEASRAKLTSWKLAGIYIGTVVGAGFASGQEVLQYFGFWGGRGIWAIILATILFGFYGTIIFQLGHRWQAGSHRHLVMKSGGPIIGRLVDAVITFFLLGAFTVMAAGAGAVFREQFGLPALLGNIFMIVISVGTVLLGIEGVLSAIGFVAPILVGSVLLISFATILTTPIQWQWADPAAAAVHNWPFSAITYVSYNLVLAVAVLAPTGALAEEKELKRGSWWGGIGLGLSILAIHLAIMTQVPEAARFEVPMLYLVRRILGNWAPLYSIVLLAEVYTTAAGSLFGFVARWTRDNIEPRTGGRRRTVIITLLSGLVAFAGSRLGFSPLVAKLFSAVGYAGFLLLIILTKSYFNHLFRPAAKPQDN